MNSETEDPKPLDLEWRPRAHLDRESIAIYLGFERRTPQTALQTIEKIDAAIERARLFPDAGGRPHFERLDHHDYRTVLAKPYIIFYRFNSTTLTMYRIMHQRQEIDTYAMVELAE